MLDVLPIVSWPKNSFVRASVLLVALFVLPAIAAAQSADKRWGVSVAFTPTWTADLGLQERLLWGPEDYPAHEGSEFTVGFVRGTARGSELGVSFVRKPIKDSDSTFTESNQFCGGPGNAFCNTFVSTETTVARNVLVNGVEVHFVVPIVTLANRVQLGVNVGGGGGFPSGTVTKTYVSTNTSTQPNQPPQIDTDTSVEEMEAAGEVVFGFVPLIKAEAQAALLVAPGLKVKVSVGLNAPTKVGVRIGAVYLFGAR